MTPGDLLDPAVSRYIVAVIMAPMPDAQQTKEVASNVLASLNNGRAECYWIMSGKGKRCGAIAFTVGPYSNRESEKDLRVLYVVGVTLPQNASPAVWSTIMQDGRDVARVKGCRYIIFDVAPNGPMTEGIINAALEAKAQARFTLEV